MPSEHAHVAEANPHCRFQTQQALPPASLLAAPPQARYVPMKYLQMLQ
jgi:hypothetical protein